MLIAEAQPDGRKITPNHVVRIDRDENGKIVWLEQGDSDSGVTHIMKPKRVQQFADMGIPQDAIVDLVFQAARFGTAVGITSTDRVVFDVGFRDSRHRVAVTIGDNGYIVGAHPTSFKRKLKPLHDHP